MVGGRGGFQSREGMSFVIRSSGVVAPIGVEVDQYFPTFGVFPNGLPIAGPLFRGDRFETYTGVIE